VITGLDIGGAETMLLKLLAGSRGWDPMVVSVREPGPLGPRFEELGIPVYYLDVRRQRPNPLRVLGIRRIARYFCPQVLQGWMCHGNLAASLASTFLDAHIPVVWNIRQSLYDIRIERRLTAAFIKLGAMISKRTAAIIYNSRVGAQQHEAVGYCAAKTVIIPNGFDLSTLRPDQDARRQVRTELGIANHEILIGLVARFHPMKDHAGFLQAAGQVARVHAAARFALIGHGTQDRPELLRLIQEHQLQERISLLGDRADIPRLTAALDIACSASAWGESFSNAIGEAMACGVPCVVTDIGDNAYLVADTGLSVPARSPGALGAALHHLIKAGEAGRRQLGAAARRRIEKEFSLAAVARRYDQLYRECLAH
jgi:glycosyltransferase involved in cell wall biosynthesis